MERISGNNGTDEKYVVIAKNGNVALGLYLKAVRDYNRESNPFTIEGRLRAAAAPGCEATAQEVNDAFKGLPFEKFANDEGSVQRASCSVAIFTNQQDRQGLPEAIDALNVGQRVFEFLTKGIDAALLTVTPDKISEILKTEIADQSSVKVAGLKLAQKIACHDESFEVSVQSVCQILSDSLAEAKETYEKAVANAKFVSDEAAKVLIAAYQTSHPEFTFYVEETEELEFNLQSLLYDFGDDENDEESFYNA